MKTKHWNKLLERFLVMVRHSDGVKTDWRPINGGTGTVWMGGVVVSLVM
jgi:hypothetical protein